MIADLQLRKSGILRRALTLFTEIKRREIVVSFKANLIYFRFLQLFRGNKDRNTVVKNFFRRPIVARFVKFHPVSWHAHISMRVELYGYLLGESVFNFCVF